MKRRARGVTGEGAFQLDKARLLIGELLERPFTRAWLGVYVSSGVVVAITILLSNRLPPALAGWFTYLLYGGSTSFLVAMLFRARIYFVDEREQQVERANVLVGMVLPLVMLGFVGPLLLAAKFAPERLPEAMVVIARLASVCVALGLLVTAYLNSLLR